MFDHEGLIQQLEAWRGHDPVLDRALSDQVLRADGWFTEDHPGVYGRVVWRRQGEPRQYRVQDHRPHPVVDFVAARALLPQPISYCMAYVAGEASATVASLQHRRTFIGASPAETVALLIAIFRYRAFDARASLLQQPASAA